MFGNTYLKIAEQLDTKLNDPLVVAVHGKLEFIAMFNNQFDNSEQEHTLPKPGILIQFVEAPWTSQAKQQQRGQTLIRIHVAQHSIASDNYFSADKDDALKVDTYMDIVHAALHGFSSLPGVGTLTRVRSAQDEAHSHIFVQTMEYVSETLDCSADETQTWDTIVPNIEVVGEVVEPPEIQTPYILPGC